MSYEFRVPTLLPREEQQGENDMRDWLNRRHAERLLAAIPLVGDECEPFWPRLIKLPNRSTSTIDFGRQRFTITCETGHVIDFRGQLELKFYRPALKDNSEPIAAEIKASSDGFFCDLMVPNEPKKKAPVFAAGQVVVITKSDSGLTGQLRIVSDVCPPQSILYLRASTNSRPEMFLASDVKHYEPSP